MVEEVKKEEQPEVPEQTTEETTEEQQEDFSPRRMSFTFMIGMDAVTGEFVYMPDVAGEGITVDRSSTLNDVFLGCSAVLRDIQAQITADIITDRNTKAFAAAMQRQAEEKKAKALRDSLLIPGARRA